MIITVSSSGGDIQAKVDEVTQRVGQQILSRGTRALNELRNKEIQTLTNPSPSAPGSPPGVRTGNLRGNWSGQVIAGAGGGGLVSLTLELTSNAHYAKYLEGGTRKMAARPFIDKIGQAAMPGIVAIFSEGYS